MKKQNPAPQPISVKNLEPRDSRVVKAGEVVLSLNFEKYKTTFTEYGRN